MNENMLKLTYDDFIITQESYKKFLNCPQEMLRGIIFKIHLSKFVKKNKKIMPRIFSCCVSFSSQQHLPQDGNVKVLKKNKATLL